MARRSIDDRQDQQGPYEMPPSGWQYPQQMPKPTERPFEASGEPENSQYVNPEAEQQYLIEGTGKFWTMPKGKEFIEPLSMAQLLEQKGYAKIIGPADDKY